MRLPGPSAKPLAPPTRLLTLVGADPLWRPWKQIMVGAISPFQKRLLLHIRVSSTSTSISCSVDESSPCPRVPQPARLHAVPAAGSRPNSLTTCRVLLSVTVPFSCRQGGGQHQTPPWPRAGLARRPRHRGSGWVAKGENRAGGNMEMSPRCENARR